MELVKVTDEDNERLLHYFAQSTLPGSVNFRQRRMFNFFNQYRIQSKDHCTYVLQNEQQEIQALASLVFREANVDGEVQNVGYATDLRVSPSRKAILQWSQHFLPVLEKEKKERDCKYVFSVVAQAQRQAYNAFIRPRNIRRRMPRYHLYRRFQMVSLHGLWPFHSAPLPDIDIRTATERDLPALTNYIARKCKEKPLSFSHDADAFKRKLNNWRDLYIENFLIAEDHYRNIIGCVAPWSPSQIQRSYLASYQSQTAENFRDLLKVFSLFGMGKPLPKLGQELMMKHLAFLNADNADILYSLLYHSYKQSAKNEFLIYPHFEGDLMTLPPRSFLSASLKFGLYCILSPEDPVPQFLKPNFMAPAPEFETAFV